MKVYTICVKLPKGEKIRTKNIVQWGCKGQLRVYTSAKWAHEALNKQPKHVQGDFVIKRFYLF